MSTILHNDRIMVGAMVGQHYYSLIFTADQAGFQRAFITLGRWASNQELNFTWFAAAKMMNELREARRECGHV